MCVGERPPLLLLSRVQSNYWLYLHTGSALSYSHFVLCSGTVIPFHLFWLVCCRVISPDDLFVFLRPALDQCFMDSCQSSFWIPSLITKPQLSTLKQPAPSPLETQPTQPACRTHTCNSGCQDGLIGDHNKALSLPRSLLTFVHVFDKLRHLTPALRRMSNLGIK